MSGVPIEWLDRPVFRIKIKKVVMKPKAYQGHDGYKCIIRENGFCVWAHFRAFGKRTYWRA
jgi:hypothetical protein